MSVIVEAGWANLCPEKQIETLNVLMDGLIVPQFKLLIEGEKLQNLEHLKQLSPSERLVVAL